MIPSPPLPPLSYLTLPPCLSFDECILRDRNVEDGKHWRRLDMTCPRGRVPATASSLSAGEAGDDDVEKRGDGADDSSENTGDTVNDGHEASPDGLEERLDLSSY